MARRVRRTGWGQAAALLAVALLTLAGVRSNVMQAAEAAPTPLACHMDMPAMAGMDHGGAKAPAGKADHKAHKACEFCDAVAVAPLASAAPALPLPGVAEFRPRQPGRSPGPRGPPAFEPRARGPPALRLA